MSGWAEMVAEELAARHPLQPPSCLKTKLFGSGRRWAFTVIFPIVLSPAPAAVKNGIKMPRESS